MCCVVFLVSDYFVCGLYYGDWCYYVIVLQFGFDYQIDMVCCQQCIGIVVQFIVCQLYLLCNVGKCCKFVGSVDFGIGGYQCGLCQIDVCVVGQWCLCFVFGQLGDVEVVFEVFIQMWLIDDVIDWVVVICDVDQYVLVGCIGYEGVCVVDWVQNLCQVVVVGGGVIFFVQNGILWVVLGQNGVYCMFIGVVGFGYGVEVLCGFVVGVKFGVVEQVQGFIVCCICQKMGCLYDIVGGFC